MSKKKPTNVVPIDFKAGQRRELVARLMTELGDKDQAMMEATLQLRGCLLELVECVRDLLPRLPDNWPGKVRMVEVVREFDETKAAIERMARP